MTGIQLSVWVVLVAMIATSVPVLLLVIGGMPAGKVKKLIPYYFTVSVLATQFALIISR
ncbi:MAG: hypothetical protein U5L75_00225 [Candidatus Campbellbacteria bacterium]|nr:hypothetical protein [Candidatus Campbellbacteria bacterium]